MKFQIWGLAALAAAVTISLVGCSSGNTSASADKPKSLTIMITDSPSANALKAVATTYTKNTGIAVDFVDVTYQQLGTKLVLAGKSKASTFDIAQFDQPMLSSVVPSGGLLALDSYLSSDKAYNEKDFSTGLQNYAKYDDKSYGLPLSTEPYVQFYRKDLYSKAGLTPATSWAEVASNAKAITALGTDYYGFDGPYGATGASEAYTERLYQYGGRLFDPKTFKPELNTAVAKQAMKDFVALAGDTPKAAVSGTSTDSAIQFATANVGLNINPSGWYGSLNDPKLSKAAGQVGVAPVPSKKGGKYASANILKGWLIGVSSQSKHKDAAWAFLSYALAAKNVPAFIKAGAPVVGRTSTLESHTYSAELPYLKYVKPGIESGLALPAIAEVAPIETAIAQAVNEVATQGADIDTTMKSLNDKETQIFQNSGRLN